MSANTLPGHLAALFTTAVWGITYVSTKYLVASFDPAEILLVRLIIAVILLIHAFAPSLPGQEKELWVVLIPIGVILLIALPEIKLCLLGKTLPKVRFGGRVGGI